MVKKNGALVWILVLFFVVSQFAIFIVDSEHWFDVSFSLETVHKLRTEGIGSIDFTQYDVHAPTYYYFLYGWSFLNPGMSEYHWGRELSVLFGLVFLMFVYLGLKRMFGERGEFATLFVALSSTYIHFGTEVRQYMLLLLLSAMVFMVIVYGEKLWVAMIGMLLMPLVHYFAAMTIAFFPALYWVLSKKRRGVADRRGVAALIGAGLVGIAMALMFAIPQRLRTQGTWFQISDVTSWPSSVFYAFFSAESLPKEKGFIVLHLLFLTMLIVFAFLAYTLVKKKERTEGELTLLWMGLTSLFPLAALVFIPLFLSDGFGNLYHHRFFLVLTWMFAAMCFVVVAGMKRYWRIAVLLVVLGMLGLYMTSVHYELKRTMEQTPCFMTLQAEDGLGYPWEATIVHESPFSMLPYEVYKRENGCWWRNVVSTNISRRMANGGGFDVVDPGDVYWNLTLPEGPYLYVKAAVNIPMPSGWNETVVYQDDGVGLVFVSDGQTAYSIEPNRGFVEVLR